MSTPPSSLLKTKNSTKLVKRFLQRTSDWHTASLTTNNGSSEQDDAEQKRTKKKRKRQQDAQLAKQQQPVVDEQEVVERHIKAMLSMDRTMQRPPTKSMKAHKDKKSNMELALKRMEREDRQQSKQRELAKATAPVGSSRSSAVQSRTVRERTFNSTDQAKQTKEKSLRKIAKLLQKSANKKLKQQSKNARK